MQVNEVIGEGAAAKIPCFQNLPKPQQKNYKAALQSSLICNSCRYCEGLCAVFPAMEKKREFSLADMDYLANLCHQCGECFYDCQYAPPHEFNVSIPQQFAALRQDSYAKYAFLGFLGRLFERNALFTTLILLIALFLGFFAASGIDGAFASEARGDFFKILPYNYMVGIFVVVGAFSFIALCVGFVRFARAISLRGVNLAVFWQSLKDALSMRYLGGHGGEGCTYPHASRSNARRVFHHLTAYGFLFCFIATNLGAFYSHILGIHAPYDFTQPPKIFGFAGGIFLCLGTIGLLWLKRLADTELIDKGSVAMDYALIIMLFLSSFSGLVLLAFKNGEWLAYALYFHLSTILALFVMLPYSKFVHIFYRFIALLKYNADELKEA